MSRSDDSSLDPAQVATVLKHADLLLREASAVGRFPTPIEDLMAAAKVTVVPDADLCETFLQQLRSAAKAGVELVKSAFSKVLGLFDSHGRLVHIDASTPKPRVPFIKLHEAGHGTIPHQCRVYRFIHDCDKTLDPDVADLFEREANVFASEVLFQGDLYSKLAADLNFGVRAPMALAKKFGSSNYASFRRYVHTNVKACCLVVVEPAVLAPDGSSVSEVRRVVASQSFGAMFDCDVLARPVGSSHPLVGILPVSGKRMVPQSQVVLTDLNGDSRLCLAEAFDTTHNVLILLLDLGPASSFSILMPGLLA